MTTTQSVDEQVREEVDTLMDEMVRDSFPVLEIFGPTLQGEGHVIGMQTMFVRFGGCDYRCKMCDSLHAVLPKLIKQHARKMRSRDIANEIIATAGHCKMVTLSGGNPAMWDLTLLVRALHVNGFTVAIETQGTLWREWINECDYITISPKGPGMGEKFEQEKFDSFGTQLSLRRGFKDVAIKVVLFNQEDIEFAKHIRDLVGPSIPFYLSLGNPYPPQPQHPEVKDQGVSNMTDRLMGHMLMLWEDVKNEPLLANARFLPQMHVLLWANKQGV